ncbi:MAG: sigma-70 family RNA polymerase sigma factor [Thermoleophilia bacterium]
MDTVGALVDRTAATADTALLAAARGGDQAAYGELFERYHARIYNYAYGIAGNPEDAADIAQEAFVRVFQALPRMTGELNFSAYLYRTAHNTAIDAVKHRNRFVTPDVLDLQAEPALRADPERVALVQEQQDHAWRAAFALSDNHRAILTLRELHDMSYQEIAEVLDMPRTTVGVLLSRARLKFKEAFRMSSIDTESLVKECRDMLPLLSAYIDEELDRAARDYVHAHLEQCAFCRLALEEMTEASGSYRVIVPLIPPDRAEAATWARLSEAPASGRHGSEAATGSQGSAAPATPRRLWSKLVAGGLAAVAIVVLGVSVADGMSALSAYRATSTTTVASVVALAADTDPSTGATAAVFSDTSTSGEPLTTEPVTTEPPTTEPPATARSTQAPTSTTRAGGTTGSSQTTSTASTLIVTPTPQDTAPLDTEPPATPALASPANGAVVDGGKVKLVWRGVKDPSGVSYRVDIQKFDGTSYLPLQTLEGLTGTAVGHAMKSTFERWRVTAVDGRGNASAPSGWWTFSQPLTLLTPSTGLTLLTPSTGLILQTTSTIVLY